MDLAEVCQGRGPSPSQVLSLIEHLTPDSAFRAEVLAAQKGTDPVEWRLWQSRLQANLLSAEQIDFIREGTAAHVGKKYKLKPHDRPGAKAKPRVVTVTEINSGARIF